jgi:hypothetical protein
MIIKNAVIVFGLMLFHTSCLLASSQNDIATTSENRQLNQSTQASEDNAEYLLEKTASFVDDFHSLLTHGFDTPAVWFDGFFANEDFDEEVQPGSNMRWQTDYFHDEFGFSEVTTRVRGSFKLPKASKKLRLVFEGDSEDSVSELIPENIEDTESALGLLYEFTRSASSNLSLKLSLSPSATLRYKFRLPVSDFFSFHFTQELFRDDATNGVSSQFDFIKTLSPQFVLRQSNRFQRIEDQNWVDLGTSLVLFQHLEHKNALSYAISINGLNEPEVFADNAKIAIRYRQQFLRKWLNYEISPETSWSRLTPDEVPQKTNAIFFRLEVNFKNL